MGTEQNADFRSSKAFNASENHRAQLAHLLVRAMKEARILEKLLLNFR